MWRLALETEDESIVEMSRALYLEDPAPAQVPEEHARETLRMLRAEPNRGRAVVLDLAEGIAGYALLVTYWSNELGGEVLVVDELFIRPDFRGKGYGRMLFAGLGKDNSLWPRKVAAIELEVTPQNDRAARLYASLGFRAVKNTRMRFLRGE